MHRVQVCSEFDRIFFTSGLIYKMSYDYLTIVPKLRSTYAVHLIYETYYEGRKVFLRYDSLAKS